MLSDLGHLGPPREPTLLASSCCFAAKRRRRRRKRRKEEVGNLMGTEGERGGFNLRKGVRY